MAYYDIRLTPTQRRELEKAQAAAQAERNVAWESRLKMVELAADYHSVPHIAVLLRVHEQTVRRWLGVFLNERRVADNFRSGYMALRDMPRSGRPPTVLIPDEVWQALEAAQTSTWTLRDIQQWLYDQHGIIVGLSNLSRLRQLRRLRS